MILSCVAYKKGHRLHDIQTHEIGDHLGQPDRFVWVALHDPSAEELTLFQNAFGLHELAIEDTLEKNLRPKLVEYGDSLFMVMQMLTMQQDELESGQLAVFAGPGYVLSVRQHTGQGFSEVRQRCESEPDLLKQGPAFVLYALMDTIVDRYFPLIEALEEELESIEDQIFVRGEARQSLERLYLLKRKAMQLKHATDPLSEATIHLFGSRAPALCRPFNEYYRDVYHHLHRIQAAEDSVRELIITAIQVNLSMVAIEEGEVTKRLAAWAAIFAVATIFVGIWGMNFTNMPELEWSFGYPLSLATIVSVCGLLYWGFRRARWL